MRRVYAFFMPPSLYFLFRQELAQKVSNTTWQNNGRIIIQLPPRRCFAPRFYFPEGEGRRKYCTDSEYFRPTLRQLRYLSMYMKFIGSNFSRNKIYENTARTPVHFRPWQKQKSTRALYSKLASKVFFLHSYMYT